MVSTSTLESPAIHEPDCTSSGWVALTGINVMSPGREGATLTVPPAAGKTRAGDYAFEIYMEQKNIAIGLDKHRAPKIGV